MTRARPLAAVLAAGFLIASCGSARAAPQPARSRAPTATSSPAPTTIPAKVRRAITDDYQAFWRAVFAAYDPPRPDDPNLARYGSGSALSNLRQALETDAQIGVVRRGNQALDPTVLTVTGATATVRDCYTNNLLSYALAGNSLGVPANTRLENPAPPKLRVATLIQDGGVWKVDGVSPPVEGQRTCGSIKDEQRVIEAYKRYETTMSKVFSKSGPNPKDARLARVLARKNDALKNVQESIRDDAAQNLRRRRSSLDALKAGHAEVASYDHRGSATVQACFVDDGEVANSATNEVVSPPDTTPSNFTIDLTFERTWKVLGVEKGGPCTLGG
jgi:hypothetical protein